MNQRIGRAAAALAVLGGLALATSARAADLEQTLNARWRGGWVVVTPAIASACDGFYSDNAVVGTRTDSRARRRFEAGELARLERIAVKRARIDVFLDLAEGVLEPRQEGPFTLYEALTCKVQLQVPVDAKADPARVEARLAELLELHDTAAAAEASRAWNGRRREPYPADYQRTLARYEAWRAEQQNAAVGERLDDAIEEAALAKERIRTDPDYLEGFAAGVEKARGRAFGDCASLAAGSFYPDSAGGSRSSTWKRGYEDGQRLAWNLELARRLRRCFVPVPPAE
jgi:hypothetical protein